MQKLIIIGAGPGGYECAVQAARQGLEVHVIDSPEHVGGTCLNEGCIPTKCLCHSAAVADILSAEGALDAEELADRHADALRRKEEVIGRLRDGVTSLLRTPGITFHPGRASFVSGDPHSVKVGEETLTADAILIATGSEPRFLPVPGAHTEGVLTSEEMLSLGHVPERLCVIGGGVVGLEFASVFRSFGSEVTVVEFAPEILPAFDGDIARRLRTALKKRGITVHTGSPVTAIHADSTRNGELHVSFERKGSIAEIIADTVLMAVGRSPRFQDLNLEGAGIAHTPRGITVDEHMQTSVPGVYAVGDVNGLCPLAHAATAQSFAALAHMLGKPELAPNLEHIPAAVFTVPECATVGLTESKAKEIHGEVIVRKSHYRSNGRALSCDATPDGLVKIICTPDGRLLGGHIIGNAASELIHELAAHIHHGGTLSDLRRMVHAHPTLSELLAQAAGE